MRLTDDGARLVPLARATVVAADEVLQTAARLSGGRTAQLRLGFLPFPLTSAAQVHMAIVRAPFAGAERLRSVELHREPVLVVVPDGHPLSRLGCVPMARLAEEPFLGTSLVRDRIFAAFWYLRDIRTSEAMLSRSTTVEEWLAEVALGRGVNMLPASFAAEYGKPGLAFDPIEGRAPTRVVLAWNPESTSEPVHALAQLAAREATLAG